MFISVHVEKAFQHLFTVKLLIKLNKRNFLSVKFTANIVLNSDILTLSPQMRNKARLSALTASCKHCTRGSSCAMKQEYQMKGINLRKEEAKLSLFVVNGIFYSENHKESTKTITELTTEFNKDAGYRISRVQKQTHIYIHFKKQFWK